MNTDEDHDAPTNPSEEEWEAALAHARALRAQQEEIIQSLGLKSPHQSPKVWVSPRADDDPPEIVARFKTDLSDLTYPEWGVRPSITVRGVLERYEGRLVIMELTVRARPSSGQGGIRRSVLRDIPLARIFSNARDSIRDQAALHRLDVKSWPEGNPMTGREWGQEKEALIQRFRQTAGQAEDAGSWSEADHRYARAAELYLALQSEDWGRGILVEMARLHTEARGERVTWRQVKNLVDQATSRGFLTKGHQGKAGREAGPTLIKYREVEG